MNIVQMPNFARTYAEISHMMSYFYMLMVFKAFGKKERGRKETFGEMIARNGCIDFEAVSMELIGEECSVDGGMVSWLKEHF